MDAHLARYALQLPPELLGALVSGTKALCEFGQMDYSMSSSKHENSKLKS